MSWPVGTAIKQRRKIFYSLFLVQQTAMYGVFISLDLMLYYGFWELSLVPMAILIAMYGRKDGPKAAIKFFLFTFIPSAPLLVAILWLYARTGTFDFIELQVHIASGALPAGALFWVALAFLFAFAVKVPVFPLHGWLADTFGEAPVAMAMVVAGKLGLYSMLRFHVEPLPCPGPSHRAFDDSLAVIGILYGACLALVQRDFWRFLAFAALSHLSLITLGVYGFTFNGTTGAMYQILNHESDRRGPVRPAGGSRASLRNLPDRGLWWFGKKVAPAGNPFRNRLAGHDWPAPAERICRRIPDPFQHLYWRQPRWAVVATLGVILSAAYMLWMVQRIFYGPESNLAIAGGAIFALGE